MYVITGATGNTGHIVAKRLLERGKKVRVLGRSTDRLSKLTTLGAEPFVVDLSDRAAVAKAFASAEAAYVMLPPNLVTSDVRGFQDNLSDTFAAAIEQNEVGHVVALSSIGADKTDKTGPIVGLHVLEQRLGRISGLNTLAVRAAYFMENTLPQVSVIQHMGVTAGPLRPDLKVPMIDTRDIGEFAADALLRLDFKGFHTPELLGQRELAYPEVASIIGNAIGKPDLRYQQLPIDQFAGALQQMGMSENMADLLAEMSDALNTGHVRALEARSARNTTPTSFEQFVAEEFVPAYQQKSAA